MPQTPAPFSRPGVSPEPRAEPCSFPLNNRLLTHIKGKLARREGVGERKMCACLLVVGSDSSKGRAMFDGIIIK